MNSFLLTFSLIDRRIEGQPCFAVRHTAMAKVDPGEAWIDSLAVSMVTTVDAWPTWIKKVITFSCFVVCALLLRSMSRTMTAQEERDRPAKLEQKEKQKEMKQKSS